MVLSGAPDQGEVNSRSRDRVSALERIEEGPVQIVERLPGLERIALSVIKHERVEIHLPGKPRKPKNPSSPSIGSSSGQKNMTNPPKPSARRTQPVR
ncbi:hypothetical protein F2Q69_00027982 [Brassica cretica]|uniref:Uncharacterized protein n=1 Tax=Brassica cretica TaxID=69181 RepID=A0A8S9RY65_BRACR|nr:hypothetical protein F2Q69_00027982 [Brassica cretica]